MAEESEGYKLSPGMIRSIEASTGMSIGQIRATPLAELWKQAEKKRGKKIRCVPMSQMGIIPCIGEGRGPIEPGLKLLSREEVESGLDEALKAFSQ